jgi:hypothetical protein
MKKTYCLLLAGILLSSSLLYAQAPNRTAGFQRLSLDDGQLHQMYIVNNQNSMGIDETGLVSGFFPNSCALLDLSSFTKGFLPPRLTQAARDAIALNCPGTASAGMMIYNTSTNTIDVYNGSTWGPISSGWALEGNTTTDPTINFLGTIDAVDLVIRTGNQERVRVSATGNVGIGTGASITSRLNVVQEHSANSGILLNQVTTTNYTPIAVVAANTNVYGNVSQLNLFGSADISLPTNLVGVGGTVWNMNTNASGIGHSVGVHGSTIHNSSNDMNDAIGVIGRVETWTGSTGNVNSGVGVEASVRTRGTGTIFSILGFNARDPIVSSGAIIDYTGLNIENITTPVGTTRAIYYDALFPNSPFTVMGNGSVGIGTGFPTFGYLLEVTGTPLTPNVRMGSLAASGGTNSGNRVVFANMNGDVSTVSNPVNPTGLLSSTSAGVLTWTDPASIGLPAWALAGNTLTGGASTPNEVFGSNSNHDVIMRTVGTERMRMRTDGGILLPVTSGVGNVGVIMKNNFRWMHDAGLVNTNAFLGSRAGSLAATGGTSVGIGSFALSSMTVGDDNIGIGYEALRNNTSTNANTAVGSRAMRSNTAGANNVAIGTGAMRDAVDGGNGNIAIGVQTSMAINGAALTTAVGYEALMINQTGNRNTALGAFSLFNNVSGSFSTAVGSHALTENTASNNTGVGYLALERNTTGTQNIALGAEAGRSVAPANANVSGNRNSFIGYRTGFVTPTQRSNATAIGANAAVEQDNSMVLGSINGVNGGTANVNVGIGTTTPRSKMHVANGDVYVEEATGLNGVILKSPNGNCWRITINNAGTLVTTNIACP